jgi:hypothetical protein
MFNFYSKIKFFLTQHPWLVECFVFAVMLALYLPLQQSKAFADPDSFYHLKMAELIAAHGPVRNFIWMPFTTLASSFADQHFLYHIALIPFIKFFGSLVGMKIATAVLAALAIAALAWSMRYMGIRYAAFFALAAGCMNAFAFRIGLSKASAPGVALLMIGVALAVRRRTWALAAVAFIYVWTHGSWPALVGLGTVVIVIMSWPENGDRPLMILKRGLSPSVLSPLIALWSGAVAGIVINPFFPQNLKFYWEQIVQIAVINYQSKIGVGAEWYPYEPARLASDLPLVCLMAVVALIAFPAVIAANGDAARQKRLRIAVAVSACAGAFLLLTLRSQRHVEYFVPLAVAAAASWISEIRFPGAWPFFKKNYVAGIFVIAGSLMMILSFAGTGLARAKKDLIGGYNFTLYQKAAEYLKANTAAGEVVVHADWDDMPPLFYWDDKNKYVMGLDPTFMYRANPKRYWDYVNFTLGKSDDPSSVMKELGARYVVADRDHRELEAMLARSTRFTRVYSDKESVIYLFK